MYEADLKEWKTWAESEEGRAILSRRNEILREQQCSKGGRVSTVAGLAFEEAGAPEGGEGQGGEDAPTPQKRPLEQSTTPVKQLRFGRPLKMTGPTSAPKARGRPPKVLP